jgi:hypothetical protein
MALLDKNQYEISAIKIDYAQEKKNADEVS